MSPLYKVALRSEWPFIIIIIYLLAYYFITKCFKLQTVVLQAIMTNTSTWQKNLASVVLPPHWTMNTTTLTANRIDVPWVPKGGCIYVSMYGWATRGHKGPKGGCICRWATSCHKLPKGGCIYGWATKGGSCAGYGVPASWRCPGPVLHLGGDIGKFCAAWNGGGVL